MSSARICFPCDQSYFWEFFIDIFLLIIITIQIGHVSSRRSCSRSRSRSVRETTRSVWSSSAFEREYFAMNLNFSPSHLTKTCFLSCFKLQFRVNSGSYFLTSRTFSPAGFNAAFAIPFFRQSIETAREDFKFVFEHSHRYRAQYSRALRHNIVMISHCYHSLNSCANTRRVFTLQRCLNTCFYIL